MVRWSVSSGGLSGGLRQTLGGGRPEVYSEVVGEGDGLLEGF